MQFIQYLLLSPSYINVLNVYAFCNTHDITWGTKGDDKAPILDKVKVSKEGKVDVNIPSDDKDLDAQYEAEMAVLSVIPEKEVKSVDKAEKQVDYYKGVRSGVVLVWIFSNFALAATILNSAGLDRVTVDPGEDQKLIENQRSTIYLSIVLWSVAGLSAFRFLGATWFLIVRMVSTIDISTPIFLVRSNSIATNIVPRSIINGGIVQSLYPNTFLVYLATFFHQIFPTLVIFRGSIVTRDARSLDENFQLRHSHFVFDSFVLSTINHHQALMYIETIVTPLHLVWLSNI